MKDGTREIPFFVSVYCYFLAGGQGPLRRYAPDLERRAFCASLQIGRIRAYPQSGGAPRNAPPYAVGSGVWLRDGGILWNLNDGIRNHFRYLRYVMILIRRYRRRICRHRGLSSRSDMMWAPFGLRQMRWRVRRIWIAILPICFRCASNQRGIFVLRDRC